MSDAAQLTLPDVRPLRTVTDATAFMRMRAAENVAARAKPPRRISQRFVRCMAASVPSLVRAVLVAEDAAFFGRDGDGL